MTFLQCQNIRSKYFTGSRGELAWIDNWISYLDTMLQIWILCTGEHCLRLPTRIAAVSIDPKAHIDHLLCTTEKQKCMSLFFIFQT